MAAEKLQEGFPKLDWVKNDPAKHNWFYDGSRFLIMYTRIGIQIFEIVTVNTDGDYFGLTTDDDEVIDLQWHEVEYFHTLYGEAPVNKADVEE